MEKIINRLKRVEGQIRGLQRMIVAGEDCDKFLDQLTAARSALDRIGRLVIVNNMKKCVGEKVGGDEEFLQNLDEAITLFAQHIDRLK
ncbi:MAG TPA: transcriptional regulator [Actinobacteria bacterium]|nr:transcriptional regulator [Actinomycetes bacterium]HEX21454.1 transcriptional regulator [Actinomycetota bacterium]